MEPRARASRHKATLNFGDDLHALLYGAGTPAHPDIISPLPDSISSNGASQAYLRDVSKIPNRAHPPTPFSRTVNDYTIQNSFPETVRILDEIVTDFIIETSHAALDIASYAGRAKLKYSDFEFVMRRDRRKLGRMQDMMRRKKAIQSARKGAGLDEGGETAAEARRLAVKDMQDLGDFVGEEGTGKGRGKGKGRRKKRNADEAELDGGGEEVDLDVDVELDELEGEDEPPAKGRKKTKV